MKAFMPGRSGRLVGPEGFENGFELWFAMLEGEKGLRSLVGVVESVLLWSEVAECDEMLLPLRPSLRMEPRKERVVDVFVDVGSGVRAHGVEVGILGGALDIQRCCVMGLSVGQSMPWWVAKL